MTVFRLTNEPFFPDPNLADEDGLLAVGGDLSPERLLEAYCNGIFPWYSQKPILWWSPDPRFVLFPEDLKISSSMKKFLKKNLYNVTFDACFKEVMSKCGSLRKDDTWINKKMIQGYTSLHTAGIAHSVETWYEGKLVGGLYGISIGSCFFGESMFSIMDNASKTAFIHLVNKFKFSMIDCQIYSKHLESLGAINIDRHTFLDLLDEGLKCKTALGSWNRL